MSNRKRTLRWMTLLALLAVAGYALLEWLTPSRGCATIEAVEKIEAGMSVAEVAALFGGPGRDSATDPVLGPGAAHCIVERDFLKGTGMLIYGTSWRGMHGGRAATAGAWKIWQGRQGRNRVVVGVCFDARGQVVTLVGYELLGRSPMEQVRAWLGL